MGQCGAMACSKDSICCDAGYKAKGSAAPALCGGKDSTCCYNPITQVANLCGEGSSCNTNTGHCYASSAGEFQCGAIACSKDSICCDAGYKEGKSAALCGGKDSTCCYNPLTKVANLCGKGSHCNVATGKCYARKKSSAKPGLSYRSVLAFV